jgi:hypothetical protein
MPADDYIDMRMLVNSGTDEDGEPNLRPWLQIKDDNPPEPKPDPKKRN